MSVKTFAQLNENIIMQQKFQIGHVMLPKQDTTKTTEPIDEIGTNGLG